MNETPSQQRYRRDSRQLAELGQWISGQLEPIEVRIPEELARQALAAWEWDNQEPLPPETHEQKVIRGFAGYLALIGLALEERGRKDGPDWLVRLHPFEIANALFASEYFEDYPVESNTNSRS